MSTRAAEALLIALMGVGSVFLWIGIPAGWLLVAHTIPAYGNPYDPPDKRVGLTSVAMHITILLLLFVVAHRYVLGIGTLAYALYGPLTLAWLRFRPTRNTIAAAATEFSARASSAGLLWN